MKPIKIVSYNTYLISNRFNQNRVTHPEQRASRICRDFLSSSSSKEQNQERPDLCFFQEVWGAGIPELTATIEYSLPPRRSSLFSRSSPSSDANTTTTTTNNNNNNTNNNNDFGTYENNDEITAAPAIGNSRSGSFVGTIMELMDTLYFHWQETGGLYDFSKPSMTCRYRSKHTFAVSRSKSKKGVEATLWDVPQWWSSDDCNRNSDGNGNGGTLGNKRLLVFNTHLDPWYPANRSIQIREILDFIENTLQSIENANVSLAEEDSYDWSHTGVLVVGDFNIKAGSEEYWETLKLLESMSALSNNNDNNHDWNDYFFHPGETDDDNEDQQHTYALQNSMVEYPEDCGRIDYMFGIQRLATKLPESSTDRETTPSLQPPKRKLRTFMPLSVVSRSIRKEQIGAESSDHYALIMELIPAV